MMPRFFMYADEYLNIAAICEQQCLICVLVAFECNKDGCDYNTKILFQ